MSEAPKDGTRLLVWCRHWNWKYAVAHDDQDRWEGWVIASWTDFNGGGWTWHGHCGEFLGWIPLPVPVGAEPPGMTPKAALVEASPSAEGPTG